MVWWNGCSLWGFGFPLQQWSSQLQLGKPIPKASLQAVSYEKHNYRPHRAIQHQLKYKQRPLYHLLLKREDPLFKQGLCVIKDAKSLSYQSLPDPSGTYKKKQKRRERRDHFWGLENQLPPNSEVGYWLLGRKTHHLCHLSRITGLPGGMLQPGLSVELLEKHCSRRTHALHVNSLPH